MEDSFIHKADALVLCFLLFVAMTAMVGVGRLAGKLWLKQSEEPKGGLGSIHSVVFALFGFILAFTFSISASRFENYRDAIIGESNNIGTAIMRADSYPDSIRTAFRTDFKAYVQARIRLYSKKYDSATINQAKREMSVAGDRLWLRAMQQSKEPGMLLQSQMMIPALNAMFDQAVTREVLLFSRVPDPIVYMLFILSLASSFIAGFTSSDIRFKDWIVVSGFALLSSMIIFITLDLGRPLRGFIKSNSSEVTIKDLRGMLSE